MRPVMTAPGGSPRENPLGSAPILGLMVKFAIPSVMGMLVSAAYNITDQVFIGNIVGMLGNAATNVAFPIFFLTSGLSQLVGVGMAANFSISLGAKKEDRARKFVTTGLVLTVLAGLALLALAVVFRRPILLMGGATETVYPYALAYFSITAIGLPFHLFSMALSYLIRSDGSPMFAMVTTASGAGLNILLDWLFMAVLGMGIRAGGRGRGQTGSGGEIFSPHVAPDQSGQHGIPRTGHVYRNRRTAGNMDLLPGFRRVYTITAQ